MTQTFRALPLVGPMPYFSNQVLFQLMVAFYILDNFFEPFTYYLLPVNKDIFGCDSSPESKGWSGGSSLRLVFCNSECAIDIITPNPWNTSVVVTEPFFEFCPEFPDNSSVCSPLDLRTKCLPRVAA